jgi:hypothetical protein
MDKSVAIVESDPIAVKISKALSAVVTITEDGIGDLTIAQRLRRFSEAADNACRQAERAVISSAEDLGKAADLAKAISDQMASVESTRKVITQPADTYKKTVMDFFNIPLDKFGEAKATILSKSRKFRDELKALAEAEAQRLREAASADVLERAQAAAEIGGTAAADQVLEDGARVVDGIEAQSVKVSGHYGGSIVDQYRYTGEVTDAKRFLTWLCSRSDGEPMEYVVGFRQQALNKLSRRVLEEKLSIPGFRGFKKLVDVVR